MKDWPFYLMFISATGILVVYLLSWYDPVRGCRRWNWDK